MELLITNVQQWAGENPWPILIGLVAINIYTYCLFALDKSRAEAGGEFSRRRIPENTLLLLALIGGSPAMVVGQKLLRHKTRKQPFGALLNAIVILQVIALVFIYYGISF
jgi:uncharacterized membrane protein YsdA (DUF1294 family)